MIKFARIIIIATMMSLTMSCSCGCSSESEAYKKALEQARQSEKKTDEGKENTGSSEYWTLDSKNISLNRIWNNGTHSAFTSILEYKGMYYIAFREFESHIFDSHGNAEGKVRILVSQDGEDWTTAAFFGKEGVDLRDPKLSIMPDGRMMVTIGGSFYENKVLVKRIPHVCFSSDGVNFTEPQQVKFDTNAVSGRDWIWRVTWHEGTGYAICYSMINNDATAYITLLSTKDGISYDLVSTLDVDGWPNEATVRFLSDGTMAAVVRRSSNAYWGISKPPYTSWKWTDMGFFIGGPDMYVVNDNYIVLSGRATGTTDKTAVWVGTKSGIFTKEIVLQSSGDTGYSGLLKVGNSIWCSYYSADGSSSKAVVYLAKIPLIKQ